MAELFKYPNEKLEHWNGCQRNWDYSNPVKEEHVKQLIDISMSAPSKNNLNLLEIQVFENSLETQKSITKYARGSIDDTIKTSTEAPLTFFIGLRSGYARWLKEESPNDYAEMISRSNGLNDKFYQECAKHSYMAASVIVGAISLKAIELGYKTGINCCFMENTKMHNSDNTTFISVGIGHPFYKDHSLRKYSNTSLEDDEEIGQGPVRPKYKTTFTHIKDNNIV